MLQLGSLHTDLVGPLGSPLPKRSRLSLKRTKLFPSQNCLEKEEKQAFDERFPADCLNTLSSPDATQEDNIVEVPIIVEDDQASLDIDIPVLGLPNCGNTCFINSVLQVLRYTPNFLDSLHNLIEIGRQCEKVSFFENEIKEIVLFDRLHDLYVAMKKKENTLKNKRRDSIIVLRSLKAFILTLREISPLFEEGEQHDAHEFLLSIISTFSSSCKTMKNIMERTELSQQDNMCQEITSSIMEELTESIEQVPKKKTILTKRKKPGRASRSASILCSPSLANVDDLDLGFQGKLRITAKCLECETRREKEDVFYDLGFPFAHPQDSELEDSEREETDTVDLRHCLAQHCHSIMRDENKVNCDLCCRKNETKMSSEVISTPPVLLLNLTDSSCSSGFFEKAITKVTIPLSLRTSENMDIFDCEQNHTYSLYAMVVHIGHSTEAGHYVSFIRERTVPAVPEVEVCCALLHQDAPSNRWFLFDDETVSLICTDEGDDTFPYFNYLGVTASPKMIFYCK